MAANALERDTATDAQDDLPGSYSVREAAGYLWVTMPPELRRQRPPTPLRIRRWVRNGVIAPQRGGVTGRDLWIDFEDLVSCRAVTLLREAGFRLDHIRRAEHRFAQTYGIAKPFSHRDFWFAHPRIFGQLHDGVLLSDVGQLAWDFVIEWLTPLRSGLRFATSGRPDYWEPAGWEGVTLEPAVQFGQSCLKRTRIPTSALWGYHAGGDSVEMIAQAYGIRVKDVERAIEWERQVRAALNHSSAIPD